VLVAGPAAHAQERTPSPEALWEAYPLEPGEAPLQAEPDAQAEPAPAPEEDGGVSWLIPVMLAAPLVFLAGMALGRRRRRSPVVVPAPVAPPAPKRFDWREYPPPARPAPPPPPVPRQGGQQ
jgi:hypothetical protein